jgi:serine kinase of HPr protein (carbohydrate metabolism regulator)
MALIHASCVEIDGSAALLRGAPGSGKSDLALRLIDSGARLVADDQVEVVAIRGELIASAPDTIAGLVEVRGLGLVRLPDAKFTPRARLSLVIDLGPSAAVARLPEAAAVTIEGVTLPLLVLAPFEASAPAKVRLALADVVRVPTAGRRQRRRRE